MEKQKPTTKIYFILLLFLGLIIIWESVLIVNNLLIKERSVQLPEAIPTITTVISKSTPEAKRGIIKISLEENQQIVPNATIKAKVELISPDEEIGGADVILIFDPRVISLEKITGNNEIFDQIVVNNQKQKEGRVKITAYQPKIEIKETQTLAFVTFRLLENKPTSLGIEFLGPDAVTDSNLVSQKTQKDILGEVQPLTLILK